MTNHTLTINTIRNAVTAEDKVAFAEAMERHRNESESEGWDGFDVRYALHFTLGRIAPRIDRSWLACVEAMGTIGDPADQANFLRLPSRLYII